MAPTYRQRGEVLTSGAQVIFRYLLDHPLDYRKELRHGVLMPNGTFQYHLQVLEDCKLVRPVRFDGRTYYRILVRGAPRVALMLQRLGWNQEQPESLLADIGVKVDAIHLAADRAISIRAARESAAMAPRVNEYYGALRALLVI